MNTQAKRTLTVLFLLLLFGLAPGRAQDLVAHWRFDQPDRSLPNLVTNGPAASLLPEEQQITPTLSDSSLEGIQKAISFDGSGTYWLAAPSESLGEEFTIEIWARISANETDGVILANTSGIILMARPGNRIGFFLAGGPTGGEWFYTEATEAFELNEWTHIVARLTAGKQELFVETQGRDLRSDSQPITSPGHYDWALTSLGLNASEKTQPLSGEIAALKLYKGVLKEADFDTSRP